MRTHLIFPGLLVTLLLVGCNEPNDTMFYQTEDPGPENPPDTKLQELALPEWEERNPEDLGDQEAELR